MLMNVLVFALIGFFGAALARMWIPALQSQTALPIMFVGLTGAVLGGLISWYVWPALDVRYHYSGYLMSMLGATLAVWVYSAYFASADA